MKRLVHGQLVWSAHRVAGSPRANVAHGLYDHTSVLRMIEWRWNLRPLTVRDATANNLAEVLDFSNPNVSAPQFTIPAGPFGMMCMSAQTAGVPAQGLLEFAASFGFPVAQ